MKTLITLLLSLSATVALAQPKSSTKERWNEQAAGPIAGGGGYVTENSRQLLEASRDLLVEQLKNASEVVFSGLPEGWTRGRLIKVIAGVRDGSKKPRKERDGVSLEFNYDWDTKGEYIEARSTFYEAHASVPVNYGDKYNLESLYAEVQLKMLHETAHLMGIGRTEATNKYAKAFGKEVMRKLQQNYVVCAFPEQELTKDITSKFLPDYIYPGFDTWVFANLSVKSMQAFFRSESPLKTALQAQIRAYTAGDDSAAPYLHHTITRLLDRSWSDVVIENGSFMEVIKNRDIDEDRVVVQSVIQPAPQIRLNPLLRNTPFAANLTISNLETNSSLVSSGACRTLAQPIKFDYTKFGGVK